MVAASGSAKESSEQANLTAPLKSPSSSLADTLTSNRSVLSFTTLQLGGLNFVSGSSLSSLS